MADLVKTLNGNRLAGNEWSRRVVRKEKRPRPEEIPGRSPKNIKKEYFLRGRGERVNRREEGISKEKGKIRVFILV